MYVRRKNCEYGRIKRSSRKPKPCDTFSTNFGCYAKLALIWAAIIILDFLIEFRFEYIWPCWLLIRTVNDSFKYQGLMFAVFFTLIALTADFVCYLLVPSSWIFLFGSTCVWMELVWHAERGLCAPTVGMCFVFLYVEVAVRLRDPKSLPFSIDLCRPFAAHCIGYPVVTLGFGLKSLITHQLRLRRQSQVQEQNAKYFYLLEQALPEEARTLRRREFGNGQVAGMNAITLPANGSPTTGSGGGGGGGASTANGPSSTSASSTNPSSGNSAMAVNASSGSSGNGSNNNNSSSATGTSSAPSASSGVVSGSATAASPSTSTTTVNSSKSSRKQQQQQNLANGKTVSANCDHSLASSNHAVSDRKLSSFDGNNHRRSSSNITTTAANSNHQHNHASSQNNTSQNHSGERRTTADADATSAASQDTEASTASTTTTKKKSSNSSQSASSVSASVATPPTATAMATAASANNGGSASSSSSNSKTKNSEKSRNGKEASAYKLEDELRRMRHERQSLLVTESALRSQLAQLTTLERTSRTETNQARQEVEYLQSKLSTLTQRLETERENVQLAEKKAAEEKRLRADLEVSLAAEKRARREAENALKASANSTSVLGGVSSSTVAGAKNANKISGGSGPNRCLASSNTAATAAANVNSGLSGSSSSTATSASRCTSEVCAQRIHDLESRIKSLTRELEAHYFAAAAAAAAAANQSSLLKHSQQQQHQQNSEHHRLTEFMVRVSDLEAENSRLKALLKAQDKVKQELLAEYHNSLKEITELNSTLTLKEYQIVELYMRMDMMHPGGPFNFMLNSSNSSNSGPGCGVTNSACINSSASNANTTVTNNGGGGSSVLAPLPPLPNNAMATTVTAISSPRSSTTSFLNAVSSRSPDPTSEFDFGLDGWPTTTATAASTAFNIHRFRSESNPGGVLHQPQPQAPLPQPLRLDSSDLEAASTSLPTPEFLSKLRSQLAAAAAAAATTTTSGGGNQSVLSSATRDVVIGPPLEPLSPSSGGGGDNGASDASSGGGAGCGLVGGSEETGD